LHKVSIVPEYAGSQLNGAVWVCVTLLSKKSCALIIDYIFWSSNKSSSLIISTRVKVTGLIFNGHLLRGIK